VLADIGYVTDSADDLIPELTPYEFWEYCALVHSRRGRPVARTLQRARALAEDLDLVASRRPLRGLSLGMRRKAQLVAAMMVEPRLIVLDEPMIGLDFFAVRALEALLAEQRACGVAALISSHDLGVIGRVADRVAVLHQGRLVMDTAVPPDAANNSLEQQVATVLDRIRAEKHR
jgi:ABC-type multidrug transport system ATPase subunit